MSDVRRLTTHRSSRRHARPGDAHVAAAAGDALGVQLGEQREGVLAGDAGGLPETGSP